MMTKPCVIAGDQSKAYLLRDIAFYWAQDSFKDLLGPLYHVFCGGHKLVDDDDCDYAIVSKCEFLNVFSGTMNIYLMTDGSELADHLNWYMENEHEVHDETVYRSIFRTLHDRNISFEYKYPCTDNKKEELLKAERLVSLMIGYKDNHALGEGRIEEYFELARLDLDELQHAIQDRVLLNTFNELAPCKVLSAYFTTHLRLPETVVI